MVMKKLYIGRQLPQACMEQLQVLLSAEPTDEETAYSTYIRTLSRVWERVGLIAYLSSPGVQWEFGNNVG